MTARTCLIRIVLMLGLLLGPVHQLAMAGTVTRTSQGVMSVAGHSAMSGGHAAMGTVSDASAQTKAALDLCIQHCLAGTAILPQAPAAAFGGSRIVRLVPDPETEPASLSLDPTGPPPKSAAI